MTSQFLPRCCSGILLVALFWASGASRLEADEVALRNGMRLSGRSTPLMGLGMAAKGGRKQGPIRVYNVTMVDTGLTRVFIPRLQVAGLEPDQLGTQVDTFPLRQHRTSRSVTISRIGQFVDIQPFDEWGRRKVTLRESDGKQLDVYQAVTELTPTYLKLEGMNYLWESGIATTAVPAETLDKMLRKAIQKDNPDHRLAVVRFYLQAKLYRQAQRELKSIEKDFPEMANNVAQRRVDLAQLQAKRLLQELNLRKAAGQHGLVYDGTLKFPAKNVSRSILRDVNELRSSYEQKKNQRDQFVTQIHQLRESITDPDKAGRIEPVVESIVKNLNVSTLNRLESFFLFTKDSGLSAEEQLGLAISGSVLGSNHADTNLDRALNLWRARELVLEYLTVDTAGGNRRAEIVREIDDLEGINAESIAHLLPLLPSAVTTPGIEPGHHMQIQVESADESAPPVSYSVVLPPEYHSGRNYPMIVALRGQGRTTQQEAEWWAGDAEKQGQAQRHGYIVIAPQYAAEDAYQHTYDANSHHIVLEAIHDACRRFQVDSDRIFLSGHSMGADAAFDIGMSHPHLFAGVIPICGVLRHNCLRYWSNAKHLPFYVVGGELDRNTLEENAAVMDRMMRFGYDIMYVEYVGRGREGFYEEIHNLFNWMALHERQRALRDFEMLTFRESDGQFYWYEASGLPERFPVTDLSRRMNRKRRAKLRPMNLDVHVSQGNTISVTSPAAQNTVWLSPDVIDFDSKLKVKLKSRLKWNDFVEPNIETMLEDYRRRGDRQLIYWARLDF